MTRRRRLRFSVVMVPVLAACMSQVYPGCTNTPTVTTLSFDAAVDGGKRPMRPSPPDASDAGAVGPDAEREDAALDADHEHGDAGYDGSQLDGSMDDASDAFHEHPPDDAGPLPPDATLMDSGVPRVPGPPLRPCTNEPGWLGASYIDLTDPGAVREVEWNNASPTRSREFQLSNMRCVKVKVGQSFTWNWDGLNDLQVFHVMIPNGGDTPSFVSTAQVSRERITATFGKAGTYGYTCAPHPTGMSGVIWVVE
jgi:plastocyanin